jgi:hypothetical protein
MIRQASPSAARTRGDIGDTYSSELKIIGNGRDYGEQIGHFCIGLISMFLILDKIKGPDVFSCIGIVK